MTGPWAGSKVLVTPRSVTAGLAGEVATEPGAAPEVGSSSGSAVDGGGEAHRHSFPSPPALTVGRPAAVRTWLSSVRS